MMRKTWLVALGLGLVPLIGCSGGTNGETNNTIPQVKNAPAASGAPGPPTAAGTNVPSGYPGADEGKPVVPGPEAKREAEAVKAEGAEVGTPADKKTDEAAPKADEAAPKPEATPKKAAAAANVTLSADEVAEINKLPDAKDRKLALAQKVCPISGEHLGMALPIKKEAEGQVAFLCCEDCAPKFEKDPKAALAKLGK